jgi:hypothetical protein
MWQVKNLTRWTHKFTMRSLLLAGAATLLVPLAPTAGAQVSVGIGVGVNPPMCAYGYYNYAPYGCAPSGFYGPGYFYNGVFLGVGPWAHWGYGHGWGEHRFNGAGGGRYHGNGGHAYSANHGHGAPVHANHSGGHVVATHSSAPHGGGERH